MLTITTNSGVTVNVSAGEGGREQVRYINRKGHVFLSAIFDNVSQTVGLDALDALADTTKVQKITYSEDGSTNEIKFLPVDPSEPDSVLNILPSEYKPSGELSINLLVRRPA